MEICTLGTASGLPTAERGGQTIVLTLEGERAAAGGPESASKPPQHFILDTGDGASSLLARHGYDHRHIAGIFISHMHADHHGGFAQVLKTCMHLNKQDELVVLAPAEGIEPLKAYLSASYLFDRFLGFPVRWISLADCIGHEVELPGRLTLRAHPNEHLAWFRRQVSQWSEPPPRPCTFESYSAVLAHTGTRVVYSGNLNGPAGADELAPFVEPCDLLIMELAHVDPVKLGGFLAGREIGHTVVTHFHPKWDGCADEEIMALIQRGAEPSGIRGRVTLPRDGFRCGC